MKTGNRKSARLSRHESSSSERLPVGQRGTAFQCLQGVASGLSSEEAAVEVDISGQVGKRWFWSSLEMPSTHLAPSTATLMRRNLTFSKREEISL